MNAVSSVFYRVRSVNSDRFSIHFVSPLTITRFDDGYSGNGDEIYEIRDETSARSQSYSSRDIAFSCNTWPFESQAFMRLQKAGIL